MDRIGFMNFSLIGTFGIAWQSQISYKEMVKLQLLKPRRGPGGRDRGTSTRRARQTPEMIVGTVVCGRPYKGDFVCV
jgi:hypothetical protein